MKDKTIKRCAIYTRKSNEDGLEQEYNTLEAQRDRVQNLLQKNAAQKIRIPDNNDRPYLLKGILVNPNGYAMTPSSKLKGDKLYRYYVSMEAIKRGAKNCSVKTVSAQLIEEIILDRIKLLLTSPEWIGRLLQTENTQFKIPDYRAALANFETIWDELFPIEQARIVQLMIKEVVIHPDIHE